MIAALYFVRNCDARTVLPTSGPNPNAGRLEHDRRRSVAEEDGDVPVGPVHVPADELHADHDGVAHRAGPDHPRRRGDAVAEARAGRVQIHRGSAAGTESDLHSGRAVGAQLVVAHTPVDDEVQLLGIEAGARERPPSGERGELRGRDV